MADVEDLRIILRAEVDKAVADLGKATRKNKEAEKSFEDLGKQFKKQVGEAMNMKSAFSQMAGSVAAGLGAFTLIRGAIQGLNNLATESVQAFQEQEQAYAKLEGVLRATGGAAGYTVVEMQEFASELQSTTQYGDEAILGLQSTLSTFKSVSGEVFKDATRLAVDLSAAFGGDLQSSAMMVGKALEDPVKGITALRRAGVSFSDAQQEVIKELVETGNKAEAQRMILEELEGQVGGVAATMASTGSGALTQYKNVAGDTNEEIGRFITAGLEPLARTFTKVQLAIQGVLKEQNDYNQATKAVSSGTATADQRLIVLAEERNQLESQIRLMDQQKGLAEDLGGYTKEQYEFAVAQLKSVKQQQIYLSQSIVLQGKAAAVAREKAEAEAKAAEKAKKEKDALDVYLERVNEMYAKTSEGRISLLEKEISEFEEYAKTAQKTAPQIAAILEMLKDQLEQATRTDADKEKEKDVERLRGLYAKTEEGITSAKKETVAFVRAQYELALAGAAAGEELSISFEEFDAIMRSLADDTAPAVKDIFSDLSESIVAAMNQLAQDAFIDFFEALGEGETSADAFGQAFGRMAQEATRQIAIFALAAGVRILAETGLAGLPIALALFGLAGVSAMAGGAISSAMSGPRTVDYSQYITDPVIEEEKRLAAERLRILEDQLEEEKKIRDENLRKLEAHFSQEFEILRDLWDRGLISTDEYASRSTALREQQEEERAVAEQPYVDAETALEAEEEAQRIAEEELEKAKSEKLNELAREAEAKQNELNSMNGWDRFWSSKDEKLREQLEALDRRIRIVQNADTIDQVRAAATGADYMTNGPELLMVGDNPGGRERVRVEPISSPNINGPRSDGVVIQINAPVYGIEDLYEKLEQAGQQLERRGRVTRILA